MKPARNIYRRHPNFGIFLALLYLKIVRTRTDRLDVFQLLILIGNSLDRFHVRIWSKTAPKYFTFLITESSSPTTGEFRSSRDRVPTNVPIFVFCALVESNFCLHQLSDMFRVMYPFSFLNSNNKFEWNKDYTCCVVNEKKTICYFDKFEDGSEWMAKLWNITDNMEQQMRRNTSCLITLWVVLKLRLFFRKRQYF